MSMTALEPMAAVRLPRLGFVGLGWIGTLRMQSLLQSGSGVVAAVADPADERLKDALRLAPDARAATSLDELLQDGVDGVVIATPSALHAEQAVRALEAGCAVFCQKPLARTEAETRRVLAAARRADRLLGVDLSYRHTAALREVRRAVQQRAIGDVYAVELIFHNAYGPNMGWARDPALAGGGCIIDLGIHLLDMLLWCLDFPDVQAVSCQRFARGRRLDSAAAECEDYAAATLDLAGGASARLVCSWESSTGRDAIIEAVFHGTGGTAALRNLDGSFYDFTATLHQRADTQLLAAPPDDWGGRALVTWARRLGTEPSYDPDVETIAAVAATLDRMLGR